MHEERTSSLCDHEIQSGPRLSGGDVHCERAVTDLSCSEIPEVGEGSVILKVRCNQHGRESPLRSPVFDSDIVSAACTPTNRNLEKEGNKLTSGHHTAMVVTRRGDVSLTLKESRNDDKNHLNRIDIESTP